MSSAPRPVLFDASALLAWGYGEPGAELVEGLIPGAAIAAPNMAEVALKLTERGVDAVAVTDELVSAGLQVVPFEARHVNRVSELRRLDVRARKRTPRRPCSLADLCCLAVGLEDDYEIITADRSWTEIVRKARIRVIR